MKKKKVKKGEERKKRKEKCSRLPQLLTVNIFQKSTKNDRLCTAWSFEKNMLGGDVLSSHQTVVLVQLMVTFALNWKVDVGRKKLLFGLF